MENPQTYTQQKLYIAGLGQLSLVIGSLAIPKILSWKDELAKVRILIKQMFWTYAAYILVINLCFGLISMFDFADLTNGSTLAILLSGFIAVYWISRVAIQFLYFDRGDFPKGKWNTIGEVLLITLFVLLSVVYSCVCYSNYIRNLYGNDNLFCLVKRCYFNFRLLGL